MDLIGIKFILIFLNNLPSIHEDEGLGYHNLGPAGLYVLEVKNFQDRALELKSLYTELKRF